MFRNRFVLVGLTAIAASALGYLINQLPEIPNFPNKDRWIIAAVVLITVLSVAIACWQARQEAGESSSPALDKLLDTRKRLLQRLQRETQQRLDDSLHQLIKLDLQMEDQQQQVGQLRLSLVAEDASEHESASSLNRVLQVFQPEISAVQLPPTRKIMEVFNRSDIQGKLLILGEPGAGKTTELLTLDRDLLKQAIDDESAAIPIIFDLSAWKEDKPIDQWLVEQVTEIYKIPASIGKQWLDTQQLLPLLDGLDELGLVRQRRCVESINRFLEEHQYPHLVVCCRREEYEQGQLQLEQLKGAVYLQPLTNDQIEDYFQQLKRASLWQVVVQTPELLALARFPLFSTMIPYAYQGRVIHSSGELFENYIAKRLAAPESQGVYPAGKAPKKERTQHYIVWLARQLEANHSTEFLIEGIQPSWLGSVKQKRLYKVLSGLIFGLIYGLSGGLIFGLIFGLSGRLIGGLIFGLSVGLSGRLIGGLIFGLSVGLIFGLIGGLIGSLSGGTIKIAEQLKWSWRKAKSRLSDTLIFGLIFGLTGGLTGGLSVGLISGLIFGLIFGLSVGLSVGLISVLISGLSGFEMENKIDPNQGIWKSATNALVLIFIVGLIGGLIGVLSGVLSGVLIFGLISGLSVGLIFGLIVGLIVGGYAVIQHCTLRVILYHDRHIPWNYARFLDHAVKHRFIQRVGGRYRFMHDLLRKHFAQMPLN